MDLASTPAEHEFVAAALDHTDPHWADFVARHELERWGEPCALLAKRQVMSLHGFAEITWQIYVVACPPFSLMRFGTDFSSHFGSGMALNWEPVPSSAGATVANALAWAAAHVGTVGSAPWPGREPLGRELAPAPDGAGDEWEYARVRFPPVELTVTLTEDLDREALATWLDRARTVILEPIVSAEADRVSTEVHSDMDPSIRPFALDVYAFTSTESGRITQHPGDLEAWQKVLTRVRSGKSTNTSAGGSERNGSGRISQYRSGVELRTQSPPPFGSAPGTAKLTARACTALAAKAGLDLDEALTALEDATRDLFPGAHLERRLVATFG